ncbi:Nucleotidyl transferase [Desulfovibrio sp. X2]|uniref:sugar phosphate nucleotidyltransferase n=1 Tax=Desulfovibrio sp. X2 TaxID=941449 RepID=UPI0003588D65|nr:sugar phosphate nucleotidyltransferase [Desulfovibrio sp. X2]EPR37111.1 Nucleotidyl transferase [Desulfovibrio sp. X2]
MKAIIMAGGKGTRLAPYTAVLPKPLMPLGDMPILELILRQLKHSGVTEVILAVNHLSHIIRAFFDDGQRLGMRISYSYEDHPLGTAGPLGAAIDELSEHFLLLNGDLLCNLDFGHFVASHLEHGAQASIATYVREIRSDFGVLSIDGERNLVGYSEKPVYRHEVSMGLYVLSREAVRGHVRPNEYLDMPDLIKLMIEAGQRVYAYEASGLWLDIGRPDDYAKAQDLFAAQRGTFLPEGA